MLERQLYLLEKLLLAFFIALNIRPLLDLFPKNNQYQITVMLTSIMLMLILLYKVITYRDKESVEIQKPKSN